MFRWHSHFLCSAVAFLYLCGGIGASDTVVLCVDSHGHSAIETTIGRIHCENSGHCGSGHLDEDALKEPPCRDTSLAACLGFLDPRDGRLRASLELTSLALMVQCHSVLHHDLFASPFAIRPDHRAAGPPSSFVRGIILQI